MPIVVNVLEKEEYNTWLSEKKTEVAAIRELTKKTFTLEELMVKGEETYNRSCASCHMANGEGIPGVFPGLKGSAVSLVQLCRHLVVSSQKWIWQPSLLTSEMLGVMTLVMWFSPSTFSNSNKVNKGGLSHGTRSR